MGFVSSRTDLCGQWPKERHNSYHRWAPFRSLPSALFNYLKCETQVAACLSSESILCKLLCYFLAKLNKAAILLKTSSKHAMGFDIEVGWNEWNHLADCKVYNGKSPCAISTNGSFDTELGKCLSNDVSSRSDAGWDFYCYGQYGTPKKAIWADTPVTICLLLWSLIVTYPQISENVCNSSVEWKSKIIITYAFFDCKFCKTSSFTLFRQTYST